MSEWLDVVVQSTSPTLRYEGDWISAAPSQDVLNITNFRSYPFSKKLWTVLEGKTGSLFYNFTGMTRLRVQGTVNVSTLSQSDTFLINCNVSPQGPGVTIESATTSGNWTENLYEFCEARNLSPSESYTLNFTMIPLQGQYISFDRLLLDPTPSTNLDTATVIMDHRHLMIQYDPGLWENFNDVAHITNTTQAKMRLDFNGTSVKWYTAWQGAWGTRASDASWTIDDLPFQRFTIPTVDPRLTDLFLRELLFETPELSPGQHRLEVTYDGTESSRPLALDNLVIQKSLPVASAGPSSSSSAGNSAATDPSTLPSTNAKAAGAKVAIGVSTSIAGLLVCGVILFFMHRLRRNKTQHGESGPTRGGALSSVILPYLSGSASPVTSKTTPITHPAPTYPQEPTSSFMSTPKGTLAIFEPCQRTTTSDALVSAYQEDNPPPYQASGSPVSGPSTVSDAPRRKP